MVLSRSFTQNKMRNEHTSSTVRMWPTINQSLMRTIPESILISSKCWPSQSRPVVTHLMLILKIKCGRWSKDGSMIQIPPSEPLGSLDYIQLIPIKWLCQSWLFNTNVREYHFTSLNEATLYVCICMIYIYDSICTPRHDNCMLFIILYLSVWLSIIIKCLVQ